MQRIVSLCWNVSADSPLPPKPSSLGGGNAPLGRKAALVGDGRQGAREQAHVSVHRQISNK